MKVIREFEALTGYTHSTVDLALGEIMPARRDRWWCVLANPAFPKIALRPFPSGMKPPVVGDLLPFCPAWDAEETEQLSLDMYETRNFETYGGIAKNFVHATCQLQTALHGWGNQLGKCPCGCRNFPMNESRLAQKGLHGALILLESTHSTSLGPLPKTRHIHPFEAALLHGVNPSQQWLPSLRLSLAGLGQMASPVQANWVSAQVLHQVETKFDLPTKLPEVRLGEHFQRIFSGMADQQPALAEHPAVVQYVDRLWKLLQHSILASQPTSNRSFPCAPLLGEKQPPNETAELEERNKQPPSEAGELEKKDKQPPTETAGLESSDKQPAVWTREPVSPGLHAPNPVDPPLDGLNAPPAAGNDAVVTSSAMDLQPSVHHGGIPGFASFPCACPGAPDPMATIRPQSSCLGTYDVRSVPVTQILQEHFETHPEADDSVVPDAMTSQRCTCILICPTNPKGVEVVATQGTTIGTVTVAEDKLGPFQQPIFLTNLLGSAIPAASLVGEDQCVMINMHVDEKGNQVNIDSSIPFHHDSPKTSWLEMLQGQGPWVEATEFRFYLDTFTKATGVKNVPILVMPRYSMEDEMSQILFDWGNQMHEKLTTTACVASAMLIEEHWIPVIVQSTAMCCRVLTTPDGIDWVKIALDKWGIHAQFVKIMLPQVLSPKAQGQVDFACGFQSIGWLYANHASSVDSSEVHTTPAIQEAQAIEWRTSYRNALIFQGNSDVIISPGACRFGGANQQDINEAVKTLLIQHGVPEDASHARANMVIDKIGRMAIIQAIRSPHAWRELKSLANSLSPKVPLVLPSELSEVIQKRTLDPKPIGNKQSKQKGMPKQKGQVHIRAEDVGIPHGIFRETQGDAVSQLQISQINHDAKGVVVVNMEQAKPYLACGNPVSSKGLALLVIGANNNEMTGVGAEVRFPARCETTQEPILMKAYMIQLGRVMIQRNQPETLPAVEEVFGVSGRTEHGLVNLFGTSGETCDPRVSRAPSCRQWIVTDS